MASKATIFFAGIGTSALLIGAGFGGGVLLGHAAVDAPHSSRIATSKDSVPPARVVLPALPTVKQTGQVASEPAPLTEAIHQPVVQPIPAKEVEQQATEADKDVARKAEKEKQAVRQEKREKQQAAKRAAARDRHKRYVAQRTRQEAARKQQEQQPKEQVQQEEEALRQSGRPSLLAFDRDPGPREMVSFFGD